MDIHLRIMDKLALSYVAIQVNSISLMLESIIDLHGTLFIFLCPTNEYTCMVSARQFGLSSQDILKDANMITITQFMLIELADKI